MNAPLSGPDRLAGIPAEAITRLDPYERELLAEIVESSLRVVQRHQFYGWTQGILQALLPHEILLCGVEDAAKPGFNMQYFSGSRYFRDEHFAAVTVARDGLIPRLMAEWQIAGKPFVLARDLPCCDGYGAFVELVESNELRNLVAHGVCGGAGRGLVGFYGFSRVSGDLGRSTAYRAELIVPHLHSTFMRVLTHEAKSNTNGRAQRPITSREAEILKWIKEGKTNVEIARALELSPWTVKNHVQTILKKLSAQTRGHAVARAISMGILDSGE